MNNRTLSVMKDPIELVKELKEMKNRIKVYEIHAERIKKQLIEHHFVSTDTIYCPEGLIVSTYKPSIRTTFQTTKFQKEEPKLYDQYLDLKEIFTLLIK